MAQEIKITGGMALTNGSLSQSFSTKQFNADQATAVYVAGTPSIPTTSAGTALAMGSVVTAGWSRFTNLDSTHYIEVGQQVSGSFVTYQKIMPGETQYVRLAFAAPYARANGSAATLDYTILSA